jgi:hypothetical protein
MPDASRSAACALVVNNGLQFTSIFEEVTALTADWNKISVV